MPCDTHFLDDGRFRTLDEDLFTDNLCLFPLTDVLVLVGMLWMKFFDVEVLNIGYGIGKTPGNAPVVSNHDAGRARETHPDNIDIASNEMAFVPDRWRGLSEMRIIAEDGGTGSCHSAINDPVVAAAQHAKAA